MNSTELAIGIVRNALQLGATADSFDRSTMLLGALPEFNSLSIVAIIGAIEEQVDCDIEDDEISGEIFETIGSLADFIDEKM
jgi:acyl carrier protein